MKRSVKLITALIAAVMLLSCVALSSCGENGGVKESTAVPDEIVTKIADGLGWEYTKYTKADLDAMDADDKEARISILYGNLDGTYPDFGMFSDYAIVVPGGESNAREMGVFKLAEGKDTEENVAAVKNFINVRIKNVKEIFTGYNEEAVAMAEKATVTVSGKYVYYAIADDSAAVCDSVFKEIAEKFIG